MCRVVAGGLHAPGNGCRPHVARADAHVARDSRAQRGLDEIALVGIRRRGVPLARRIARTLREINGDEVPTGALDITLYRDDLMRHPVGPQPVVRKTEIPFSIDERKILLVDDVLYTGRTIRAALDALIDFGRPRAIQLIVLVDRGHRECPSKRTMSARTFRPRRNRASRYGCRKSTALTRWSSRGSMTTSAETPSAALALRSRHLLGIAGLEADEIRLILDTAEAMKEIGARAIKKVPTLRGRTVVNLFFEPSTRTRTSFEIAEKRLSADTLSIATSTSSVTKGESLLDTVHNLEAMSPDMIVMRHASSGAPHLLARSCTSAIINAGDGMHEHPTQALLDAFTIREHKGRLAGLKVAIIGDLVHSRVLRSNVLAPQQDGGGSLGLRPPRR